MPATEAKLNWNEIIHIIEGFMATITVAAKPSAGRALFGRPSSSAKRYTLPIMAALVTDGDIPASRA